MSHPRKAEPNRTMTRVKDRLTVIGKTILILKLFLFAALLTSVAYAHADSQSAISTTAPIPISLPKDSGDLYVSPGTLATTPEATPVPTDADSLSTIDESGAEVISSPPENEQQSQLVMVSNSVLPAPNDQNRVVRVPILMYHYISDPPKEANDIRRDLSLPGPDFEQQLRYLVNAGYHSISMQDLVLHMQQGTPLPAKPVVLTFDDGYKDAFTVAFPLLKKYGFTGTFFIFTKPINEENREYLSWQEIELMSAAGMEIGCHSRSHPDLREQSDEVLKAEVLDAKREIESHIHKPVLTFCYPAGGYNSRVIQAVNEAGYWAAVTTEQGIQHTTDSRLLLQRVRVRGEAGLNRFAATLNWDW